MDTPIIPQQSDSDPDLFTTELPEAQHPERNGPPSRRRGYRPFQRRTSPHPKLRLRQLLLPFDDDDP